MSFSPKWVGENSNMGRADESLSGSDHVKNISDERMRSSHQWGSENFENGMSR